VPTRREEEERAAAAREAELEEGRMPFLEHLRELRTRLRNSVMIFFVCFIGCWIFWEPVYAWIRAPFDNAWYGNHLDDAQHFGTPPEMVFSSPVTPFWLSMEVAMWAALFVGSPFMFYQLWKFIAPGLYKKERRVGFWFAFFSGLFFTGGALFCYTFCLPALYDYLLSYAQPGTHPMIAIDQYFDLTRDMMIGFGAVFELPMLIFFLASIGLVTHRSLWKFNRYFIIIAFVVGAVLTPSPDVVSQTLMATPMVVLYNVSIVIAFVITRRREKRQEAQRAADLAADVEDEDEDEDDDEDDEE
jgi:sec-independent protein translocase protein TatC